MFCRFLRGRMFTLTELALQTWMPRLSPSLSTPLVKWRRKHQLLHPTISKAAGYVLPFQSKSIDAPLATFSMTLYWLEYETCAWDWPLGPFKYISVTNLNTEQNHAQKMNKQMREQIALVCKCVFLLYPAVRVWWTRNENKLCRWENKPFHSFPPNTKGSIIQKTWMKTKEMTLEPVFARDSSLKGLLGWGFQNIDIFVSFCFF